MSTKRGLDLKLYRNTGTVGGTPTWNEVPNVRDMTKNQERTEIDGSTRASRFARVAAGLTNLGVEFGMLTDPADPDWLAFETAFNGESQMDLAFADGDITTNGTKYLRFVAEVLKFTDDEPLDGLAMTAVAVKPGIHSLSPSLNTVSS